MEVGLNAEAFSKLLASLDGTGEQAGERYEDLRRTLIRFFEWRGGPFPEELADETLTRVARKLTENLEIRNIGGYCYEVGRYVLLEALKSKDSKRVPLEPAHYRAEPSNVTDIEEKELRLICLDSCLDRLPIHSRDLILSYYSGDAVSQIEHRKELAQGLGLRRDALANRAQRLRYKLQECVTRCLRKK